MHKILLLLIAAAASALEEEVLTTLTPAASSGRAWTWDDLALLIAVALNCKAQIKRRECSHQAHSAWFGVAAANRGNFCEQFSMGIARGFGWRDMRVAWPKLRQLNRY